jgi:fibronectin-binding autotransporter adhesin
MTEDKVGLSARGGEDMKSKFLNPCKPHFSSRFIQVAWASVALFCCAFGAGTASAEANYWDSNGASASFGAAGGTWGTDAFWSTNSAGDTLPSITNPSTSDDLNFGYTSTGLSNGTITVVTGSANSLTFAAGSGAITLSGGTITLADAATISVNNAPTNVISSVIAGAATSLTKVGTGTLTLSGLNTYSGGTTISAGTVIVGNTNALGTAGAITLGDVNSGANAITLVATANPYSRAFTVANYGGVVTLATAGGKFSGAITLNRGVKLIPNSNNAANFDGGFSGSGDLTIANYNGYGVNFRFADNTFTGSVFVLAGSTFGVGGGQSLTGSLKSLIPDSATVNVLGTMMLSELARNETIDALTGSGSVTFGQVGDMLTVGGGNGSGTFSGIISTSGSFAKTGTGAQTLTGINTYTGTTTVNGGTLLVNGKITGAGAVTVNSSGTLGGTGMVSGAVTVTSGGTFSPGDPAVSNGIGRVTVSNDVTLATNGIFAAQIAAGGLVDMLVSTRTISNQNATLSLSVLDVNALKAEFFTVMVASNIVGTFNGLPGGAGLSVGGRSFVISYPGNTNVVLQSMSLGMLLMVQ